MTTLANIHIEQDILNSFVNKKDLVKVSRCKIHASQQEFSNLASGSSATIQSDTGFENFDN